MVNKKRKGNGLSGVSCSEFPNKFLTLILILSIILGIFSIGVYYYKTEPLFWEEPIVSNVQSNPQGIVTLEVLPAPDNQKDQR